MKRSRKIGYIIGGASGGLVLLADALISLVMANPSGPFYCQTMGVIFGTHDCQPHPVEINHFVVACIALALVVLGGFLCEAIGKVRPRG